MPCLSRLALILLVCSLECAFVSLTLTLCSPYAQAELDTARQMLQQRQDMSKVGKIERYLLPSQHSNNSPLLSINTEMRSTERGGKCHEVLCTKAELE